MAKKYLKYFMTRDNQFITDELKQFITNHSYSENLLTIACDSSWLLYEAIQDAFYCNWPNTTGNRYWIKAKTCILNNGEMINQTSSSEEADKYFGYFIINGDNKTDIIFDVDGNKSSIKTETGLLLISPSSSETHSILWNFEEPLVMVKFYIEPTNLIDSNFMWTPF